MKITRTFELLDRYEKLFTQKEDALACKIKHEWETYSSADYIHFANALSSGLLELGLKPGDKIASVSNNRPEWNFLDMAMAQIGVIHVPIYPTASDEDFTYILNHVEPSLMVASDKSLYNRLVDFVAAVPGIKAFYTFDQVAHAKNWEDILENGRTHLKDNLPRIKEIRDSIGTDEVVTIIYTSGTTGNPKGVMLTHKNITKNLEYVGLVYDFNEHQRTLSFLPISHIYERTINYYFQYQGVSIYYAENMGTISPNLKEVKPHVFIAVPRVLELLYDKIIGKGKDLTGIKKQIFFWAVNLGLRYKLEGNSATYRMKLAIADKLIFSKWREAIGNNVELIVVGGAALQPRLIKIFNAARIFLGEGYGMTETSPVIACNFKGKGNIMAGTVGLVLPGVEVKISDDGEILTRSECVMKGYYKEPELTAQAIDADGWMHTGDVGEFIDGRFLKITDRKKEIFKLSSGKYIAPQIIENKFKESFFIEQAMVIGENQKFASALIVPNFSFLHEYCSRHGIKYRDNKELINNAKIVQRFQREINDINKKLGQTEQVKRFRLVHEEWSTANGDLTPTLKLKRKFLVRKYHHIIDEIFSVDKG